MNGRSNSSTWLWPQTNLTKDMKKLNEEQRSKAEIYRGLIAKHQAEIDSLYDQLLVDLNTEDNDWLFEYIFNVSASNTCVYADMVRSNLFE